MEIVELTYQEPLSQFDLKNSIDQIEIPSGGDILIVVDDITRPSTGVHALVIEHALRYTTSNRITVLVASGMHRAGTYRELKAHIGDRINELRVIYHNPFRPTYIDRNKYYVIGIGTVLPHTAVPFSGGSKLIEPGLSVVENALRFHHGINRIDRSGSMDWLVNSVVNILHEPIRIFNGKPKEAHRYATEFAMEAYKVDIIPNADNVILEPAFKTLDFQQCMNGLLVCKYDRVVKQGGCIFLDAPAPDGMGVHYLFQPMTGVACQPYDKSALFGGILDGKSLGICCETVPDHFIQEMFNMEVTVFNTRAGFDWYLNTLEGLTVKYVGSDGMVV